MTNFLKFGDLYISTSQIISIQYLATDTVEIRTRDSGVHLIQGTAAASLKTYIDGYSTAFALS